MIKKPFSAKNIKEQVIVITDSTGGLGLAIAREASEKGASVVLCSKDKEELKKQSKLLKNSIYVVADVTVYNDLVRVKDEALKHFGRIDTWINNASASIQGYLMESDIEKEREIFETNFWGTRQGCQIAVEAMKKSGGVIINLGSEISVASQPLLGVYSASKNAVRAITEALRSELRDRDFPIEVCLVRPAAIESVTSQDPKMAAEAVIKCASHPQRDVYIGGPARLTAILDTFFPKVKDIYAESLMKNLKRDEPQIALGDLKKNQ